jgi:hypothetical protein
MASTKMVSSLLIFVAGGLVGYVVHGYSGGRTSAGVIARFMATVVVASSMAIGVSSRAFRRRG